MISLGIESTAHTFGVGIVNESGRFLSDARKMFTPKKGHGFIPSDLVEHHKMVCNRVLNSALEKAKLKIKNIDIISFSRGPGIPNALQVGGVFARFLSAKYNKPLVGVNHAIAHIEIGKLLTGVKDPVVLYLSGGNTQIISFAEGRYRIFGESEDIPVGNLFDVFAREIGMRMPGGSEVEKLARLGRGGKYVELPYVVKGMNLSFTGILTDVLGKFRNGVSKNGFSKEDLCYSLQETVFAMLTEVAERALAYTGKDELLLVGGVAQNKRLQKMLRTMCGDRKCKFFVVPQKFAGDNGTNIAWTGILQWKSNTKKSNTKHRGSSRIIQNWRVDQAETNWI